MSEYKTVKTSAEVWAVIRAKHGKELKVFGSYSEPNRFSGDRHGGRMFTSYGFDGSDFPIMEAKTTWEKESDDSSKRKNEQTQYWLCLPVDEDS